MIIGNSLLAPTPWLSNEVIKEIEKFLTQKKHPKILEFGSGCSTLFFATYLPAHLVSVEHNPKWFEFMQNYIKEHNLQVDLRLVMHNHDQVCGQFEPHYFDFILIDSKDRMACLKAIRDYNIVKPGGIVMLDDSDMRQKYVIANEIMQGWQKFESTGLKGNPLNPLEEFKIGTTTWWVNL